MKNTQWHEGAFLAIVNDLNGGIARELERQARRVAEVARDNISLVYKKGDTHSQVEHPWVRSGFLHNSVKGMNASIGPEGIRADVEASPAETGEGPFAFSSNFPGEPFLPLTQDELNELKE